MPTIHAPALPVAAIWLNVTRPLTPADLRDRVVVLHFFTYACINCLHTLPVLAAAEQELAGEPVAIVGVHSPKFPTEADPALVREALRRHGVTHPVVVDAGHRTWDAYAVKSWPTLVIVAPGGTIAATTTGEPERDALVTAVRSVLEAHPGLPTPVPLPLRPEPAPQGVLAYPGGLALLPGGLVVADTDHHQLVVCDAAGRERERIGSGLPGLADGDARTARFRQPHGLTLDDRGLLVVADTGNHAVREVDLAAGTVRTLAGTGQRGRSLAVTAGQARRVDLRSPWDVAIHPSGAAVVAMAGSHQLWAVDRPARGEPAIAAVLAGSGREARVDGDHATAAFAQPSGLAYGPGGALFVADSENSAVRRVTDQRVDTLAGGDLFVFGDADGPGDLARFQHPVGIAAGPGGVLLVADTLNHEVRSADAATGEVRTLFGDGTAFDAALARLERRAEVPADARGAAFCREPEALAWDGERVLVVDTGNHRVLAVEPGSGAVEVLLGA